MKVSKAQTDANRSAILGAAGRLFRESGIDQVTVSDVMKAAGLTHGAFYGYFRSKDDLVIAALAELVGTPRPPGEWADDLAAYLSPGHRDDRAGGCPVAALASETARGAPKARAAMADGVERMIARQTFHFPEAADEAEREAAIGRVAAMVGAIVLSRAIGRSALSDEVLAATRDWLNRQTDPTMGG